MLVFAFIASSAIASSSDVLLIVVVVETVEPVAALIVPVVSVGWLPVFTTDCLPLAVTAPVAVAKVPVVATC